MEPFEEGNEELLKRSLDGIQKKFHRRVIVSTDEGWALDYVKDMRVKGMPVTEDIVENEGSYKDVLIDIDDKMMMDPDDEFVMLSLEYPDRTYRNIRSAIQFYRKKSYAKSLLCKQSTKASPQKMLIEKEQGDAEPLIKNTGQEWKESEFDEGFLHSHFVAMVQVDELSELNNWLWNEDTVFFPIESDIRRVRNEKDLTDDTN